MHPNRAAAPPPASSNGTAAETFLLLGRVLSTVSDYYLNLSNLPDRYVGWLPWAIAGAKRTCRDWKPDLIYVTGPPFALPRRPSPQPQAGRSLDRRVRDRWADDPYFEAPDWRMALLDRMERRVAGSASGIVTVSEPWSAFYRAKYGKPVATIYNGYDPQDFPLQPDPPQSGFSLTGPDHHLCRRPLFRPPRSLRPVRGAGPAWPDERQRIRIEFYGSDPGLVMPPAEKAG